MKKKHCVLFILLAGKPGTGKTLAMKYIHEALGKLCPDLSYQTSYYDNERCYNLPTASIIKHFPLRQPTAKRDKNKTTKTQINIYE